MAYTPQLDPQYSAILRRIAWAAGRPMSAILKELVFLASEAVDPEKVCAACRDKRPCAQCLRALQPGAAHWDLKKLLVDF